MWGTGLRHKFFLFCFVAILVSTLSVSAIQIYYFRNERIQFLDSQIRQTAISIVNSDLTALKTYDYELADSIISDELGPERVGKFFIIRDDKDEILFETQNIEMLKISVPRDQRWVTITTDTWLIRAVNLQLPRVSTRTMQVGIITDASFAKWTPFSARSALLIVLILSMVLLLTWLLSAYLFSPIKSLAKYVSKIIAALETNQALPPLPEEFNFQRRALFGRESDEFRSLVRVLATLTERINLNSKLTKSWTFQMAHELKTPLTIIKQDLESLEQSSTASANLLQSMESNLQKVSATISNFLNWAELANQPTANNLHVVNIETLIQQLSPGWEKLYPQRLVLGTRQDFKVVANPAHLDQMINNLVINALKYTIKKVEVRYGQNQLVIQDQGNGLPQKVLDRLGSPFNKDETQKASERGSGLGLAWCVTIAEIYQWKLDIRSSENGTEVQINFPILSIN